MGTWKSGKVRSWTGSDKPVRSASPAEFNFTFAHLFKVVTALIFVATLWIPFYGYVYITALLSQYGFRSVTLDIDIYRFVLVFFSRVANGINGIGDATLERVLYATLPSALIVGTVLGIFVAIAIYSSRSDQVKSRRFRKLISSAHERLGHGLFSLAFGIATFLLSVVLVPVLNMAIFAVGAFILAIAILFGVIGYFNGTAFAVESHNDGYCFDQEREACASVQVNGEFIKSEIIYSDSSRSYLISEEGLMMLSSDQNIVFKLPMSEVDRRLAREE